MAPPKGNKFWEARASSGRDKIFSTPEVLWRSCCEYFNWVEENPLWEMKAFHFQGEVIQEPIAKMRAMTINGLCIFLGVGNSTWHDYRNRDDFSEVVSNVEKIIYEQKFTGAAVDLFNASIISRELGLTDKQEIKQTADIKVSADMSPQEAAKAYQDLMNG